MSDTLTLRYECECGKWAKEAYQHCNHCGRVNPGYEPPTFTGVPSSYKSFMAEKERKRIRDLQEASMKLGK